VVSHIWILANSEQIFGVL